MKRLLALGALALFLAAPACQTTMTPALGVIWTDVKWNDEVTSNPATSNMTSAEGQAHSFFGFIAIGDISANTIAKRANITKIHNIDVRTQNIIGFGTLTVTVYGE